MGWAGVLYSADGGGVGWGGAGMGGVGRGWVGWGRVLHSAEGVGVWWGGVGYGGVGRDGVGCSTAQSETLTLSTNSTSERFFTFLSSLR